MLEGFGPIVRKDLRLEVRSGESTVALVSLSLLILVVMVLVFGPGGARRAEVAAGALWIALIFAGTLGATRALLAERESGCIRGLLLSPVEPATIYAAKLAVALIFMAEAGVAVLVMLVLFFNLEFGGGLLRLIPVCCWARWGWRRCARCSRRFPGGCAPVRCCCRYWWCRYSPRR